MSTDQATALGGDEGEVARLTEAEIRSLPGSVPGAAIPAIERILAERAAGWRREQTGLGIDAYTEGDAPKSEQDAYNAAYIKGRRDMAVEQAAAQTGLAEQIAQAVEALHGNSSDPTECMTCSGSPGARIYYPCPTVLAVRALLGVSTTREADRG